MGKSVHFMFVNSVSILQRLSIGIRKERQLRYLKEIVASYELRTPDQMKGNETSYNVYCLFIPLSFDPSQNFWHLYAICRPIFGFLSFSAKINFPEF